MASNLTVLYDACVLYPNYLRDLLIQRQKINQSTPDCLVTDFEYLIPSLNLPDPDDRHVLAAAIVAKADVIVTLNLKDCPAAILSSHEVIAQHPDDFIAEGLPISVASLRQLR